MRMAKMLDEHGTLLVEAMILVQNWHLFLLISCRYHSGVAMRSSNAAGSFFFIIILFVPELVFI
jgi:hypothetical protein